MRGSSERARTEEGRQAESGGVGEGEEGGKEKGSVCVCVCVHVHVEGGVLVAKAMASALTTNAFLILSLWCRRAGVWWPS